MGFVFFPKKVDVDLPLNVETLSGKFRRIRFNDVGMHSEQTDRQTFFLIYIDRLAEVPDGGQHNKMFFFFAHRERRFFCPFTEHVFITFLCSLSCCAINNISFVSKGERREIPLLSAQTAFSRLRYRPAAKIDTH